MLVWRLGPDRSSDEEFHATRGTSQYQMEVLQMTDQLSEKGRQKKDVKCTKLFFVEGTVATSEANHCWHANIEILQPCITLNVKANKILTIQNEPPQKLETPGKIDRKKNIFPIPRWEQTVCNRHFFIHLHHIGGYLYGALRNTPRLWCPDGRFLFPMPQRFRCQVFVRRRISQRNIEGELYPSATSSPTG